jgi:transposase
MPNRRKPYPSDVSDDEWSLVAPDLTLMREDAPQREHTLRELFNSLRNVIRYGIAWRAIPNDLPPWFAVYQQPQRWLASRYLETLAHDLRAVLRVAAGRTGAPHVMQTLCLALERVRSGCSATLTLGRNMTMQPRIKSPAGDRPRRL